MGLLNYTTQIDTGKTVAEIQNILAAAGARAIMTEFQAGVMVGITFNIVTKMGPMTFVLPCNMEAVLKILKMQADRGKVPKRLVNSEQAARVGWRIIRSWIEAQMAFIKTQMVTIDQVFLPYVKTRNGQTLYQRFECGGLPMLEGGKDE